VASPPPLGPVFGGLLAQADWRWVFLINLPVGAVALLAGSRVLPDVRPGDSGALPDILGAAVLTVSIGALSLGLVKGNEWGWDSGRTIGSLAAAAALAGWFLARSARHPSPVIELPLLRTPAFGTATVAAMLFAVAFAAMLLSTVLWCQQVWGYSALRTGLALAPGPLMVPALAIGAGPLARRVGAGPVAAAGNLALAAGVGWWVAEIGTRPHYLTELLPGLLLTGVGVGLALPTLIAAAATALPPPRFATGSGIVTMARQVGTVLGVAVLVSVLGTPGSADEALTAFRRGWTATAIIGVTAAAASLALRRGPAPAPTGAPATGSPLQPPPAPADDPAGRAGQRPHAGDEESAGRSTTRDGSRRWCC